MAVDMVMDAGTAMGAVMAVVMGEDMADGLATEPLLEADRERGDDGAGKGRERSPASWTFCCVPLTFPPNLLS